MPAIRKVATHAVDKTMFASLTKNLAAHGPVQDMIKTVHGVDFTRLELARSEPSEGEGDVRSVFAADEDRGRRMEIIGRNLKTFAGTQIPIF